MIIKCFYILITLLSLTLYHTDKLNLYFLPVIASVGVLHPLIFNVLCPIEFDCIVD